ncbi:cell division cycle-associated protein 4 [Sorex araneus]|uniref:cell division cycle-associated protein 4 n=1 Tax=Sorex araneus TaxID=42254 RepID=UPI002434009E|nr:cell division cycle-associated protein 4 [Sorex araneus]XP_054988682.1 cell division cycle-associated protein 4 [Sorex araneus]XP_054988683.1 cell division cycle-associated protein 4 [Sorex araneus]
MLARGLKRKSAEPDGHAEAAYSLQRQSLLDMSLVKLQLCHMLEQPDLCRSVLIANTVRQIQEEMAQDGAWPAPAPPTAGPAPLRQHLVSTEVLCRPDPAQDLLPRPPPRSPEDSLWGAGGPLDSRGGLPTSLGQIFETLEGRRPSAVGELFSEVSGAYYDLDTMLTGPSEGLEGFAAAATAPPSTSCKLDLSEREHLVGVLVEA